MARLLYRAARGAGAAWAPRIRLRGVVRDVLGERVLRADIGDADVGGFAGFGERVVAAVEVLALL